MAGDGASACQRGFGAVHQMGTNPGTAFNPENYLPIP